MLPSARSGANRWPVCDVRIMWPGTFSRLDIGNDLSCSRAVALDLHAWINSLAASVALALSIRQYLLSRRTLSVNVQVGGYLPGGTAAGLFVRISVTNVSGIPCEITCVEIPIRSAGPSLLPDGPDLPMTLHPGEHAVFRFPREALLEKMKDHGGSDRSRLRAWVKDSTGRIHKSGRATLKW